MSKEMGSSHRIDVLSDAILYYGHKAIDNIGMLILNQYYKFYVDLCYSYQVN